MYKESVAQRYAEALFALAIESGVIETVIRQLDSFVELLGRHRDLADFFSSPVVDRTEKIALLRSALSGHVHELTLNFIILLVRKRRETIAGTVARQMHELLDRHAGRMVATITAPMPLEQRQLQELAAQLGARYDAAIVLETKVTDDVLGGLVVRVGDRYVDASVSGKLEALRRHLLESADTWSGSSPNGKP